MARQRRRRRRGGQAQAIQQQVEQQWASAEQVETAHTALQRAIATCRDTYGTAPYPADNDALAAHAWGDDGEHVTRLATVLVVGCYSGPHIVDGVPQVRFAQDVVERALGTWPVRVEDVRRVEQLRACLLGVAAQLAARKGQRRIGRFVAEVLPDGGVVIEGGHMDARPCAACAAAEDAWRETIRRGKTRRQVERALHEGRRVFVDYGRGERTGTAKPLH